MSDSESAEYETMTQNCHNWQDYKNLTFYYNKKFIGNFIKCLTEKTENDESDAMLNYAATIPKLKYVFDLDDTLITTDSGNKLAENEYDWRFTSGVKDFFKSVADKEDFLLVIIANQGSTKNKLAEFKSKINAMSDELMTLFEKKNNEIFIISVFSLDPHDIIYRKPYPGMWSILQLCIPFKDSYEPIVYIGNAAGRKTDASCTDRKFARNIGMGFATPESFFTGLEELDFSWGFDPREFLVTPAHLPNSREQIPDIANIFKKNEIYVVLLVGYHGSGKTTLAKYISQMTTVKFIHISESVYGKNIEDAQKQIFKILKNGNSSIIIDYCNGTTEDRITWINFVKNINEAVKVFAFEMKTSKELAKHLNIVKYRKKKNNHANVTQRAYNAYEQDFCAVDKIAEEINEHYQIPFIPAFDDNGKKLTDFLLYTD